MAKRSSGENGEVGSVPPASGGTLTGVGLGGIGGVDDGTDGVSGVGGGGGDGNRGGGGGGGGNVGATSTTIGQRTGGSGVVVIRYPI